MEESKGRERDILVDIARGIGMFAVIVGHTIPNCYLKNLIYAFHMPLFFFLSGYLYRLNYEKSLIFVKRKFMKLITPYTITALVLIAYSFVENVFKSNLQNFIYDFIGYIYGAGEPIEIGEVVIKSAGAIWFFWASFWGISILNYIVRMKAYYAVSVIGLLSWIALWSSRVFFLPLSIQSGMLSSIYLYAGHYYKRTNKELIMNNNFMFITFIAIFIILAKLEGVFVFATVNMPSPILNIVNSFVGIYLIFSFIRKFNFKVYKYFSLMGRNSMYVLCFHLLEMRMLPWGRIEIIFEYFGLPQIVFVFVTIIIRLFMAMIVSIIVETQISRCY